MNATPDFFSVIFNNLSPNEINQSLKSPRIATEDFGSTRDAIAMEGMIKAWAGEIVDDIVHIGTEIKGWAEGVTSKQKHINDFLTDVIDWLKEKNKDHKGRLELDMGTFKTWLKTSETFRWRYYFLLNDKIYNDSVKELKKNGIISLEEIFVFEGESMAERKTASRYLDSIRTVNDMIVVVEKYRARCNVLFELLLERKSTVKGFPFQVMLLGAADLRSTVRKIVRLAE